MSIIETNAAQSAFYAANPRDDAMPAWDDLTPAEQREHADWCPDECDMCTGNRAWGTCTGCGSFVEAVGHDSLSRCCAVFTLLEAPAEDNLAALRAA